MKKILIPFLMLFTSLSFAVTPEVGVNFDKTLQAVSTDQKDKIEITELFWYGCIHCYQMDPMLSDWVKKLPKDVYFKRMPAIPRPDWTPMARAFYAMEALGVGEKLHMSVFDAVHKDRSLNPTDEKAILLWVILKSGLDRKKVEDAFNSFSMNASLNRAAQIFKASGATGVPTLMIDGRYITSSTMAGGNNEALQIADFIINNVRKDRNKK